MKNTASNINVTINASTVNLIDNSTTFNGLIDILRKRPEAFKAAVIEAEEKEREEREAREADSMATIADELSIGSERALEKASRRPGAVQLRKNETLIAVFENRFGGKLEVFSNGYAIYDNGDRKTVIWVPDCGSTTYYFVKLRDSEKGDVGKESSYRNASIMKQKDEIGEDVLGDEPWYLALTIAGEDSIERNLEHPKSKGSRSDSEAEEEWEKKGNYRWSCGASFENPETAYLKKEAAEERRKALTEKQREAYELYYEEGYTQRQVSKIVGVDQTTIKERLDSVKKKFKSDKDKFFSF